MTQHRVFFQNSNNLRQIQDCSVDLVITSPPYPMIEMWDEIMATQNSDIKRFLKETPQMAFELMHEELDKVWKECYRVLKNGAFLCINIGDATRTIGGNFALYNNHSRVVDACLKIGFTNLPNIIWRKTTNAPNKFMGSGMMPCGAYTTLEHEWILIFRKGGKRDYKKEEDKITRRESAFFWEERNIWFSDIWDIKGVKQQIANTQSRERNASFPFTIPYRIINMYSQRGDIVLDPFLGLGTTTVAAMLSERNSIGYEIDSTLSNHITDNVLSYNVDKMNRFISERVENHKQFIRNRINGNKEVKYHNKYLDCGVMTKQETDLSLHYLTRIENNAIENNAAENELTFKCYYENKSNFS